jgi:hypothetical protein
VNRLQRLSGFTLISALLVASCTSEEIVMVDVSSVEVVPATVNAVQGESHQLVATVHDDQNQEVASARVEWSSDDPDIASVDQNGVLVAHQPGTVEVHATYLGVSGSASVVVLRGPSILVSRDSVTIFSGVGGSPSSQTVEITNGGTGALGALSATVEYPAGSSQPWLTAELSATDPPASLTLQARTQGLGAGTHAASVRLTAAGSPSEARVAVVLNLTGFAVTETGAGTTVTERGASDTLVVVLTARPSSNVVLDVRGSDATEVVLSRSFLVFTPSNWNVAQRVILSAVDDLQDDGNQTSTVTVSVNDGLSDDIFEGLPDQAITVTTIDSDEPPPGTPGFSITQSGGSTRVTEGGGRDSITVVLGARPASNVVLSLAIADASEATVGPTALTFTPANWDVAQTAVVTGVDDALFDDDQTTTLTVSVSDAASDDAYDPLPDQSVTVVNADNDVRPPAGITLTESGGSTRVTEAGATDTITVVLASPPASNVVLAVLSDDVGEVVVVSPLVTFTPANWNVAQAIIVRGVDDVADDGDQTTSVTISVNDAASDDRYDPLPARTISVTTVDDDEPLPAAGFSVNESGGSTSVTEAGGTDQFSVVLTSPPASNVVLNVTSGEVGEATVSPPSLTFTPGNWAVSQAVTVTGVDDDEDDGNQTTTVTISVNDAASDDRFDPVADRTVAVTTVDDDEPPPAGMTVTETAGSTRVTEASGRDSISVVLTSPPSTNVVVDATSSNTAEATVSPPSLTFSPLTWSAPQWIVVIGVDDTADDGDQNSTVTISVNDAASDDRFDPLPDRAITVTTLDDDDPPPPAGITITESGGSTRVTEAGGTDSVTVVLTSPPVSNVVLTTTSANAAQATVTPGSLTFTPASWNVAQRFVVTGVDDTVDDGDVTTTVTVSVDDAASDDRYDPLPDRTVTVTTVDNDDPVPPPAPAGVTIAESGGSTRVTEAGGTDSITVVLESEPATAVVIAVASADTAIAEVSPASLTFTSTNWDVIQRLVVSAVNDTIDGGDRITTVSVSVNDDASDDAYDGVAAETIDVTVVDDDPVVVTERPERSRSGPSLALRAGREEKEDGVAARDCSVMSSPRNCDVEHVRRALGGVILWGSASRIRVVAA